MLYFSHLHTVEDANNYHTHFKVKKKKTKKQAKQNSYANYKTKDEVMINKTL